MHSLVRSSLSEITCTWQKVWPGHEKLVTLNVLIHSVTKDPNSLQRSLQYILLAQESIVDAQTDANFVVRSTITSVAKAASAASHHSHKFLPVTRIVRMGVCANYMGGARFQSIWKICNCINCTSLECTFCCKLREAFNKWTLHLETERNIHAVYTNFR